MKGPHQLTQEGALQLLVQVSADILRNKHNLKQVRDACWALGLAPEVRRIVETALLYRVGPWWPVFERYRDPKLNETGDVTLMPMVEDSDPESGCCGQGPYTEVAADPFDGVFDGLEDVFA